MKGNVIVKSSYFLPTQSRIERKKSEKTFISFSSFHNV